MKQELQPVPKKVLPIIYVIDTSGSMEGERIACLNAVMREALRMLEKGTSNDYYYDIRIAVLQFGSSVRWVTGDEMIPLEDYCWEDLEASGMTNMGDALIELSDKLNNERLLKDCKNGFIWPRIFFITDGYPTDDWETALEYADKNGWFRRCFKQAIGIGDDFSAEVMSKIVGCREGLLLAEHHTRIYPCIAEAISRMRIISVNTEPLFVDDINYNTEIISVPVNDPVSPPFFDDEDDDSEW